MRTTRKKLQIETPNGIGQLEEIYISELGYPLVRVYFEKDERWINYPATILKNCPELRAAFEETENI